MCLAELSAVVHLAGGAGLLCEEEHAPGNPERMLFTIPCIKTLE